MRNKKEYIRKGLKDMWNMYLCNGAKWSNYDIPICPTIITETPSTIITWTEAKENYKKGIKKDTGFKSSSFVCFYEDDYRFDGPMAGIWANPERAIKILRHFRGIVTPDFSTYQDFPEPIKIYNTFRMRAFGYWAGTQGLEVINNIRWGTEETFRYCFQGVETDSTVCIGTVGGSPRKRIDRKRFEKGIIELIKQLHPKIILIYGSSNFPCFDWVRKQGIKVISFQGATAKAFKKRKKDYE